MILLLGVTKTYDEAEGGGNTLKTWISGISVEIVRFNKNGWRVTINRQ